MLAHAVLDLGEAPTRSSASGNYDGSRDAKASPGTKKGFRVAKTDDRRTAPAFTVADWLEVFDPLAPPTDSPEWSEQRLRRLHGEQVALDVIAHTHNIPLRLCRLDNLQHLDQTFVRFVGQWADKIHRMMTAKSPDGGKRVPRPLSVAQADDLLSAMQDTNHLKVLRGWVLGMTAEQKVDPAPSKPLPPGYIEWFLMLLPHLERDVWLTEIANPMPVHNLTRMVEHWSLYILMWAWRESDEFAREVYRLRSVQARGEKLEPHIFPKALGLDHLGLMMLPAFIRRGKEADRPVALLAGPFLRDSAPKDDAAWFLDPFQRFLRRIEAVAGIDGWDELHEKAPGATELRDALEAKASLDDFEAPRRALQSLSALRTLRGTRMDASVMEWRNGQPNRPLSRANWETMAALASWFDRWGKTAFDASCGKPGAPMHIKLDDHRVSLLAQRGPISGAGNATASVMLTFLAYGRCADVAEPPSAWRRSDVCTAQARIEKDWQWIEGPGSFFARMRERQQAAWAAHIAGINHLLARHSRRDRPEGADNPDARRKLPPTCEEADHLLHGFGGRVCRYLLSLARADYALIYWLDYSSDPPRLRHVGSAERYIQHRAARDEMLTEFNKKIWRTDADGGEAGVLDGVSLADDSIYQCYRVAATAVIDPKPEQRKAHHAQAAQTKPGQPVQASLAIFKEATPLDAISVPLLFNDRVVGVFSLAGISSFRHFDLRLYPTLRLVAQTLAQAMYFQSQIWHMRQLNWLASHVPLEQWRQHTQANQFNPLLPAARCLANVFLCPGVNIWLRDPQNDQRFNLHGNTAPEVFFGTDAKALPDHAPSVTIGPPDQDADADVPLRRTFFAFAVDQWTVHSVIDAGDSGDAGDDSAHAAPLAGQFVQAQYVPSPLATRGYNLRNATRGALELHTDFLDPPPVEGGNARLGLEAFPSARGRLFEGKRWREVMAFALLDSTVERDPKVVGAVSLYGGIARKAGHLPWPPGWRPVVAHVQKYLPYVLMQTEAIANPLDNLRRYLLHEGRNELNATTVLTVQLKTALQRLIAVDDPPGQIRPWLRRLLGQAQASGAAVATAAGAALPADMLRELHQLDNLLAGIAGGIDSLLAVDRSENLAILGRLIDHQRELSAFDDGQNADMVRHRTTWSALQDRLRTEFDFYSNDLRARRVFWSVDGVDTDVELLTQSRLFSWLLGDLVHNVVKYAAPDSGAQVSLEPFNQDRRPSKYWLRFSNESSYDPEVDVMGRLVQYGVQGSAGLAAKVRSLTVSKVSRQGMGIGLWGVDQLAKVLGMPLNIEIRPMNHYRGQLPRARYHFNLLVPASLLRRGQRR